MLRVAMLCFTAATMAGCGGLTTVKVDPQSYDPVKISVVDNPPTKAMLEGAKPRVVVFSTEEKASLAKKHSIGDPKTSAIEKFLSSNTDLVDRSLAEKFHEEILLSEMNNKPWGGPEIAEYAITSEISHAKWNSTYKASYTYEGKKGKTYRVSAKCKYTSNVGGAIKIYQLPGMTLVNRIDITGKNNFTEDAGGRYRSGGCQLEGGELTGILEKAIVNAVEAHRTQLQNVFAPKGYITERRSSDDGDIFRITLGSELGAGAGDKVMISRTQGSSSQLGGSYTEVIRLGEAEIAEPVERKYAWVYIDKIELADRLKIGDSVQLVYEEGVFEALINYTKK